jgi:hypothetical protein
MHSMIAVMARQSCFMLTFASTWGVTKWLIAYYCLQTNIKIDTRPKLYCDDDLAQTMRIPHHDLVIPIQYHGPLLYFNVCVQVEMSYYSTVR